MQLIHGDRVPIANLRAPRTERCGYRKLAGILFLYLGFPVQNYLVAGEDPPTAPRPLPLPRP